MIFVNNVTQSGRRGGGGTSRVHQKQASPDAIPSVLAGASVRTGGGRGRRHPQQAYGRPRVWPTRGGPWCRRLPTKVEGCRKARTMRS